MPIDDHAFLPSDRPREERREFLNLFLLFLLLRIMIPFWLRPFYSEFSHFIHPFMRLSDANFLPDGVKPAFPFIDYWLEYPPLLPYLALALYRIQSLVWPASAAIPDAYSLFVSVVTGAVDALNLLLVYLLALQIRGHRFAMTTARTYALLFFPLVVTVSYFDGAVLLTILLATYCIVRGYAYGGGLALSLGFLMKFIPIVVLPAALKYMPWRETITEAPVAHDLNNNEDKPAKMGMLSSFLLTAIVPTAVVLLVFLALSPMLKTSFEATARRPAWETPQALIAGHWGFGYVGPSEDYLRRNPQFKQLNSPYTSVIYSQLNYMQEPEQIRMVSRFTPDLSYMEEESEWWQYLFYGLGAVGIIALMSWFPSEATAVNICGFVCVSLCLGFLVTKGWSPQFIVYLLPFILLAVPPKATIPLALLLTAVTFFEMPIWLFLRLHQYPAANAILLAVVVFRTVLLLSIMLSVIFRARRTEVESAPQPTGNSHIY